MPVVGEKDIWEKAKILSMVISFVLIPIAVVLIGNWYTTTLRIRELDVRYVEIAIKILMTEPRKETKAVRLWAIDIINGHSQVRISREARRQILDNKLAISNIDFTHGAPLSQISPSQIQKFLGSLQIEGKDNIFKGRLSDEELSILLKALDKGRLSDEEFSILLKALEALDRGRLSDEELSFLLKALHDMALSPIRNIR